MGETTKNISIVIKGDNNQESDEQFKVRLSHSVNATIIHASGIGTITNDDSASNSISQS